MSAQSSTQDDCPLAPLEQQLYANLQQAAAPRQLVVALSGGLDSKVLLHALVCLRDQNHLDSITAIHVNHGLQADADQWQAQNQRDCDSYQVPLVSVRLALDNTSANLEAIAREERYRVFESKLKPGEWLVMAHHQDDQAETLLFRLLRGCGIAGAGAMPGIRPLGKGHLLRPLLTISRADIHDYAGAQQLSWLEDPSNANPDYSRNFIRHQIMPAIEQKWPGYAKTLSRFSLLAREQATLLTELAEEDLHSVELPNGNLKINELQALSVARQKNLLHCWGARGSQLPPSSNEIQQVLSQLAAAQKGARIKIDFGEQLIRSYSGQLIRVARNQPDEHFARCLWEDIHRPVTLSNYVQIRALASHQIGLRPPLAGEEVWISMRQGGEKCLPDYRGKSSSLKKIYQELAVPPWQRKWLPVVYYNDQIAAVPGVFVSKPFLSELDEPALQLSIDFEHRN